MKELHKKGEDRLARLDQLLALQLNGEATQGDSEELNRLLQQNPDAVADYVELVVDSSVLRGLSEASAFSTPRRNSDEPTSTPRSHLGRLDRTRLFENPTLAYIATAACIFLVVGMLLSRGNNTTATNASSGPTATPIPLAKPDPPTSDNKPSSKPPAEKPSSDEIRGVATVLRTDNVVWAKDNHGIGELTRVSAGETLHFSSGEVELVFDSTVQMRVRGPALLEIRSHKRIYSRFGVLSAKVGLDGRGFIIETPNGRVVDLGTEFGVAVDEKGSTAVAVFRGAVDLTYGSDDNLLEPSVTRRLVQGQALTMDQDGLMRRLVSFDDSRFPTFHNQFPVEPDRPSSIFTSVSDNIREGIDAKSYRIVPGGLREDVLAYVDRQHQWNGVDSNGLPDILRGADYIMPFNSDKGRPQLSVEVSIGRPSRLFVFMSPVATVPAWLSQDFQKTDMQVGLDESGEFALVDGYHLATGAGKAIDTEFTVWQRDIEYASTVVLGSVRQARRGTGYCMYGIAAVPLEYAQRYDSVSE